ncbi:uncharacterized protein BO97DRAFT_98330 [Aspergillus homomorphus CBS 101889]|uniref:Uncharacterized protein n=1 Tax=Aspergillus homomorphus (strain CBS 101889) TaxID=1450537 RepID=A0A395HVY1_ASPHC|nr:hypothetical protein BO97DRAFT_98330 [Aspergillus homomorphus CBS 101889]RAL11565.1 hypothetical protein BO97DRAFT_98330 [Aspergillus homomorphus CBS 101889]
MCKRRSGLLDCPSLRIDFHNHRRSSKQKHRNRVSKNNHKGRGNNRSPQVFSVYKIGRHPVHRNKTNTIRLAPPPPHLHPFPSPKNPSPPPSTPANLTHHTVPRETSIPQQATYTKPISSNKPPCQHPTSPSPTPIPKIPRHTTYQKVQSMARDFPNTPSLTLHSPHQQPNSPNPRPHHTAAVQTDNPHTHTYTHTSSLPKPLNLSGSSHRNPRPQSFMSRRKISREETRILGREIRVHNSAKCPPQPYSFCISSSWKVKRNQKPQICGAVCCTLLSLS